jgi:hypothetical protein
MDLPYCIISGYFNDLYIVAIERTIPFSILFKLVVDVFFIVVKGTDNVILLCKIMPILPHKRSNRIFFINGVLIIVASKRNNNYVINFAVSPK